MELQDIKEYRDKVRAAQYEAGAKMFLDRIFSNLKVISTNGRYYFEFNDEIIADYDKITKYFYYHYDKIYQVLKLEFGFNDIKINELLVNKVNEHLKIRMIELRLAYSEKWTMIRLAKKLGYVYQDLRLSQIYETDLSLPIYIKI